MKTKAFTLVELLAILVIIGVIALIATPVINNIIEENSKKTFEISVYKIIEAAEQYYLNSKLTGEWTYTSTTFSIVNGKFISEDGKQLEFNGDMPNERSMLKIYPEGHMGFAINNGKWCAIGDSGGIDVIYEYNDFCQFYE